MGNKTDDQAYRIKELERKVKGLQQQVGVIHAVAHSRNKKTDQRLRDLEIKAAVSQGAAQKDIAKIYELSRGRVSQIVRKVA
ncbi:hypothetical protein VC279_19935 [Xanthomonas sp. WHRI 10064A]|uniref:hypothetical protein n=1 Tax=unclassified Xanthomonas TaxID=2643310 RepID=UPI002B2299CF|nr:MULTISPECIES: hypothetical protein [unclassified Xanthomonas]MEA9589192.1 hypothetical protein [Xanthomonas sp. WHRI 10064B]MEA9616885.1 hypothetical protein [Xanthomonas sp. WHRI 10064A]